MEKDPDMTGPESRNTSVVVVGGGTMGAGIAQCFAEIGVPVTVVESSDEAAASALTRVKDGLQRRYSKAVDPEPLVDADLARVSVVVELPSVGDPSLVSLVVEAVPEDVALKRGVLEAAEVPFPDAILASNTSSLSIDGLASALARPERFVGMHFFNPVPVSELVELVVGSATSAKTIEVARTWVDRLGKQRIEVRDAPGFVTSRLGLALGLEAIRMVEEEVASPEDIDRAMVLGYRHPMGPLRLTDLVGLDVRLAIAEHLAATLGDRFAPPRLLREKVSAGQLGKKTGRGFYEWR
jgi:3-hydroxybutyryl-CoA dehydrogenase